MATNLVACKPCSLLSILFLITSQVHSTMKPFFSSYRPRTEFLLLKLKLIILQFYTILQDKLHAFNIQDDQSTRFLCTTNYSIDHIIKGFHEENSIIPGLFSKKNLVLRDMQGNNYGLLVKTIKKFSKSPFRSAEWALTLTSTK